ncbi:WD40 repeat domain-containing protein [Streptomyces sp. NPDC059447]|uniref:WD40 repeat domain-containing protein n=1 Tax=Streptomyces sp. NPDC059447 TaxID=3346834 RepID=UPI00369CF772
MVTRALVSGAGDFSDPPAGPTRRVRARSSENLTADGVLPRLDSLPSVAPAVRELAWALARNGIDTDGDPLLEPNRARLLARWGDLRTKPDAHDAEELDGDGLDPDEPGAVDAAEAADHAAADAIAASDQAEAEALIVCFTGHGVPGPGGGLYLATAGADLVPDRLDGSCVSVRQLLDEAENGSRPVLFLLDVCGAGQAIAHQQTQDMLTGRPQDALRNAWVIGASTADSVAYEARFTTAAATVLRRLAEGTLDLSPTLSHLPVDDLALAIDRELAARGRATRSPAQTVVRTPRIVADTEPDPFLPNPAHSDDPYAALLDGTDPRLRAFAQACSPGLDPLHFVTRAAGNPSANVVHFSGRTAALSRIQGWINDPEHDRSSLLVVTGGPGSGKSAVLGVTACLTHPELVPLRPRVRTAVRGFRPVPAGRVLAVHARRLTLGQITDSLHQQLQAPPPTREGTPRSTRPTARTPSPAPAPAPAATTADLLTSLREAGDVLVVLDALDEALDPLAVLDELVLPLATDTDTGQPADGPGCRVILGTRPWWDTLPALHAYVTAVPDAVLDLDPVDAEDRKVLADDLHGYLDLLLDTVYPPPEVRYFADRIAGSTDTGAFLVAALFADHLLSGGFSDRSDPPCSITALFDLHRERLTRTDPWADTVLSVLGQARGEGMPLDLLHAVALAHRPSDAGRPAPPLTATRQALAGAAFFLRTTPDSDHRLLYRYFHQALTDHTAPDVDPVTVHRALLGSAPVTAAGSVDWSRVHPYLTRHAAEHAVAADGTAGSDAPSFDLLLQDPDFLVHADPDALGEQLRHASGKTARLHADIYRHSTSHHARRHDPAFRRCLLATDAMMFHAPRLARRFAAIPLDGRTSPVVPRWASDSSATAARRDTLDAGLAFDGGGIATARLDDGRTVAVVTGPRATTVWDMASGGVVRSLPAPPGVRPVQVVVTWERGRALAVVAGDDGSADVWDVALGRRLRTLHGTGVRPTLAVTRLPRGRTVLVTRAEYRKVHVLDFTTGRRLSSFALDSTPTATATIRWHGHTWLVVVGFDGLADVRDLRSGELLHRLDVQGADLWAVTTTRLSGRPVAVTTNRGGQVRFWNLETGVEVRRLPTPGHSTVSVARMAGKPVVITSGAGELTVSDVVSGERIRSLAGSSSSFGGRCAVAVCEGRLLAAVAEDEGKVVVYDLTTGSRHHRPGHDERITEVVALRVRRRQAAVTSAYDGACVVWDTRTGERLSPGWSAPFTVTALATLRVGGRAVVVAGDIGLMDRSMEFHSLSGAITAWDPATGAKWRAVHPHGSGIAHLALIRSRGRTIVASCGNEGEAEVLLRDLLTGRTLRSVHPLEAPSGLAAVRMGNRPILITTGRTARQAAWWDVRSTRRIHRVTGPVGRIATVWSRGRALAVMELEDARSGVWDVVTGERVRTVPGRIAATAVLRGRPVAVTETDERTLGLWDLLDGRDLSGPIPVPESAEVATTRRGLLISRGREVVCLDWDFTTLSGGQSGSFGSPDAPTTD